MTLFYITLPYFNPLNIKIHLHIASKNSITFDSLVFSFQQYDDLHMLNISKFAKSRILMTIAITQRLCLTGLHNMYSRHNQKIIYPLSAISSYIIPNQNIFLPKNKNFLYSFICIHFHKVPTGLDHADKEEKCPQGIADYLQCPMDSYDYIPGCYL